MSANPCPWRDAWEELDHMAGPLGIHGTMDDLAQKHGIPLIVSEGSIEATLSAVEVLEQRLERLTILVSFSAILVREQQPELANAMSAAIHDDEAWTGLVDQASEAVAGYLRRKQ